MGLRVHVGGNVFECATYESAKRLAGYFREELEARFTCAPCQVTTAVPLSQIERLPSGFTIIDASDPDAELAEWWRLIDARPGWPHVGWICDTCWAQYLAVVIRLPEDDDEN